MLTARPNGHLTDMGRILTDTHRSCCATHHAAHTAAAWRARLALGAACQRAVAQRDRQRALSRFIIKALGPESETEADIYRIVRATGARRLVLALLDLERSADPGTSLYLEAIARYCGEWVLTEPSQSLPRRSSSPDGSRAASER